MKEQFTSPRIEAWNQEFQSHGRVEVKSSLNSLIWRVGLAALILAVVIFVRYNSGAIGTRGLTIAITGSVILLAGCIAFVVWRYGGKKLIAERDGVTVMDGTFYPWSDIASVSVWSDPRGRSASAVQLNLTESAWEAHMDKQNAGGALMHKANKLFAGDRALVQPSFIDAPAEHVAAFLDQFAQGGTELA